MKIHPNIIKLVKYIETRKRRITTFLGHKFVVREGVFPIDSPFSYSSKITAKAIMSKKKDTVLDIGTSTGVLAIIAAKKGVKKVLAIDIDENSLRNAKENVKLHKLENVIKVRKSDLFKNIKSREKFNIIIFQVPFTDADFKTKIAHFIFDPGYKTHQRFFEKAKKYLKKSGIIVISSTSIANEEKLLELIKKYKYNIVKVEEKEFQNIIWKAYILKLSK